MGWDTEVDREGALAYIAYSRGLLRSSDVRWETNGLDGGLTFPSGCSLGPQAPGHSLREPGTSLLSACQLARATCDQGLCGGLRDGARPAHQWQMAERPLERMFELGRICGRSLQTAETCGRDAGTCKPACSVSTTFSPMGPAVRVSRRPSSLVDSPCVCVSLTAVAVAVAVAAAGPSSSCIHPCLVCPWPPVPVRIDMMKVPCRVTRQPGVLA